tara:strand:- start:635 stop:769 length:135 start_codon:yes stop_codon:yes gene_type:complete
LFFDRTITEEPPFKALTAADAFVTDDPKGAMDLRAFFRRRTFTL